MLGQVAALTLVIAGIGVLWVGPGGLYWLVVSTGLSGPGGFGRCVGVARRDQLLGARRGFSPPYAPECVDNWHFLKLDFRFTEFSEGPLCIKL